MSAPTIGVCGFGRCGSSMVMAMLDAGGVPPVVGSAPGSYELPNLEAIDRMSPRLFTGRAVKLLDGVSHYPLPPLDWRFVWIDRDPAEQAKSFAKFVECVVGMPALDDDMLALVRESYVTDRPNVLAAYRRLGPVLELTFESILMDPLAAAEALRLVVPDLNFHSAAAVVQDRPPQCAPGLDHELSVSRAAL